MRAVFGVLGLLFVVAIVGILVKKNLNSIGDIKVPQPASASTPATGTAPAVNPTGNVADQSKKIQQQFKSAAEAAAQPARSEPDQK